MSSKIGVQNIAHTNGTNAMTVASDGATTFTTDPFNSVIETWYYGSSNVVLANGADLSGWNRKTNGLVVNKNGGMSESSAVWTFPSTGVWSVTAQLSFYTTATSAYHGLHMEQTINNSSYSLVKTAYTNSGGANRYSNVVCNHIMNITDTTNQKIKLSLNVESNINVQAGTGNAATQATFIKLCPSV